MPDLAQAYQETRRSMTDLISDLDAHALAETVPACPDWSVRDLAAHVTSIAATLASGDFPPDLNPAAYWDPKVAELRESFVAKGLDDRKDKDIDEILSEWELASKDLEAMIRGERAWPQGSPPLAEWIVTTDLAVHHHDLRGAVSQPGERESLATGLSLRSYVEGMRFKAMVDKSPAFKIVAGSRSWNIGEGEPVATLTAEPFELARAASGRRSPDQIKAYDWQGDPEPFLDFFYPYGRRDEALSE